MTPAIAIFRGRCLIIDYVNEEFERLVGPSCDYLDRPLREVWPDPGWRRMQAVIQLARRSNRAYEVTMIAGTTWVIPLPDDDAVATHFVARHLPLAALPAARRRFAQVV